MPERVGRYTIEAPSKLNSPMPQHHPEDRVRVKNIVSNATDDVQTFFLTRQKKVQSLGADGQPKTTEVPYEREIDWNFKDGFFFMWGGKAYVMRPGEEKTYPRFLANHCVKQQIQYILNDRHQKSKRVLETGVIMYDRNILNNQVLKKQLANEIIVGVEEWYEGTDDDFDAILNKKFGGDIESYLNDDAPTNKEDFELKEIDDYETKPLEVPELKERKATTDKTLQKLRDEADAFSVQWNEGDTADQIKEKVMKAMA